MEILIRNRMETIDKYIEKFFSLRSLEYTQIFISR